MSRLLGWLLALGAAFSTVMTLYAHVATAHPRPIPDRIRDEYIPALGRIRTLDDAAAAVPAFEDPNESSRQKRIADAIDRLLRARFFHGYSELRPDQDWVAALAGHLWFDLQVPVLPDDILKFRRAACSQQAIVFMALLKRYGIEYGAVTFPDPGHFAAAAKIDGQWLYYDSDGEPVRDGFPVAQVLKGKYLTEIYPGDFGRGLHAAALRGTARLQHVDRNPAPRGALFEQATTWFSRFGWLIFCFAFAAWARLEGWRPPVPAARRLTLAA